MKAQIKVDSPSLSTVRQPSPYFRRAINLKYDLKAPDYLAGYIPTPNAAQALSTLMRATQPTATQRAIVLHGPYGSGKSLLGAVIAAIFSKDENLQGALQPVLARLRQDSPDTADLVEKHLADGPPLLPIVLYGDEGPLAPALSHALTKGMWQLSLGDHRPRTHYRAALETIEMWQVDYPDTYAHLGLLLEAENYTIPTLKEGLTYSQPEAYSLFLRLYPKLTAGATFDNHYRQSIVEAYSEALTVLKAVTPYEGIIILWDEFGRYLEAHVGEVFGPEIAILQDLAEFCNQEPGAHLTLITHKVLSGYAWGFSDSVEKEWARIAGRFQEIDVSTHDEVAYRLISEALITVNESDWKTYLTTYQVALAELAGQVEEHQLFPSLDATQVRQRIVEGAFPLHPLAIYCLPRISAQVAQNERTLFTFIASDESDGLRAYLEKTKLDEAPSWARLEVLFDYFAEAMKADTAPGGVHHIWASVDHALGKISQDDSLARRLIKSLAIMQAVQESQADLPTTDHLMFAVGEDREVVRQALHYLARRKAVLYAKSSDSWELSAGSTVDIEENIRRKLEDHPPSPLQLRRLLEDYLPIRPYVARRYNQRRGMVRFFHNWYRMPHELHSDGWDSVLRQEDYADGIIVHVLAMDADALQQARAVATEVANRRIVFVLPCEPLRVYEPLRELFALIELNSDLAFKSQDSRLEKELAFYIDDARLRVARVLSPLIDPRQEKAEWYWQGRKWEQYSLNSNGRVTRFLSEICEAAFSQTPVFNNESLNVSHPTNQQTRAADKVIDALLTNPVDESLGLSGYGPDWLIVRTMLIQPGFLRQTGEDAQWELGAPTDSKALKVWEAMQMFFEAARIEEQDFSQLIDQLQWEPFGLRPGILPLLLSLALRTHLHVATVRYNRRPVLPLDGTTFTHLCQHPNRYTLELGPETPLQAAVWGLLEKHFGERVMPEERKRQPLRYLSLGMVRWLNSLPRFAQSTVKHVSEDTRRFRQLIAQAMREPAQVLFGDLPELLLGGDESAAEGGCVDESVMEDRLFEMMGELNTAYTELLHGLDRFALENFAPDAHGELWDGQSALRYWAQGLVEQSGQALKGFQFGDIAAQSLATIAQSEMDNGNFWDTLAREIVGTSPRDWNDQSEASFYKALLTAKERVEQELRILAEKAEDVVEVTIRMGAGDGDSLSYRLREAGLSKQGQRILENLKSTLSIAGRPLSLDEKRKIALEFLQHVLGKKDT